MRRSMIVALAVLAGAVGCATTGGAEGRSSSREITLAEIEAAQGVSTAHDLIQRLRPQWLRYRGSASMRREGSIVVYVDGLRAGEVRGDGTSATGPNPLAAIAASRLRAARFYGASEATQRFGTGHAHGAIELFTRG